MPVTDLHRQAEPGQRADAAQAAQPGHHRRPGRFRGHGQDRLVQPVPPGQRRQHGVVGLVERELHARLVEGLRPQPLSVRRGPGGVLVHNPLPQQQFRKPVPGTHQIAADVFPGPHQITGGFLTLRRDHHHRQLAEPHQTCDPLAVPLIGLDPISGRPFHLRRRQHVTLHPGRDQRPRQTEPGRASLIRDGHRGRQPHDPLQDFSVIRAQPALKHLTGVAVQTATTERACTSRPIVVR